MCGIAGLFLTSSSASEQSLQGLAERQDRALVHRGPDAGAQWVDQQAGLSLSHRRLAVLDLSPAGAQPMVSDCGRYVLCYNGEIYNFRELRHELSQEGLNFVGGSDTEVLLKGIIHQGLRAFTTKLAGMFAFALWDRETQRLSLVRDRLGIKPLYIAQSKAGLAFGSELKALSCLPDFNTSLDPASVASLLQHIYIGGQRCIYAGTIKLKPGHLIEISRAQLESGSLPDQEPWWSFDSFTRQAIRYTPDQAEEATNALEELLGTIIEQHMASDVPLGAFLSGGIDSSTVVALMKQRSEQPINSFSIGFDTQALNEATHAKAVAQHLGTQHHELYVGERELLDVVPKLATMYDEPFADSSQIPTFLVSQLAKQQVTVSLSGDGGDELFCGYSRYFVDKGSLAKLRGLPGPLKALMTGGIKAMPRGLWSLVEAVSKPLVGSKTANLGNKARKLAELLGVSDDEAYRLLVLQWPWAEVPLHADYKGLDLKSGVPWPARGSADGFASHQHWRQYADTLTYLPDDILTKVDRASMAVSLEVRVPLLDHRLLDFAWSCDHALQSGSFTKPSSPHEPQGKWMLRQVLYRHVPRSLIDRPKQGFGVPLGAWLKGPLRDWCEDLLSPQALGASGMLDVKQIRAVWDQHTSGAANNQARLWPVLMFQAWYAQHAN